MGWGGTFTTIDVKTYLQQVGNSSHKLLLDRWLIKKFILLMTNYNLQKKG